MGWRFAATSLLSPHPGLGACLGRITRTFQSGLKFCRPFGPPALKPVLWTLAPFLHGNFMGT